MKRVKSPLIALILAMMILLCGCNTVKDFLSDGKIDLSDTVTTSDDISSTTTNSTVTESTPTNPTEKTTTAIQPFTSRYGVQPFNVKDNYYIYSGNVSQQQFEDYANYLLTCGYTHDTDTEQKESEGLDYIAAMVGSTSADCVTLTFNNASSGNVGIVGYGKECKFTGEQNSGINSDPVVPDPVIPDPTPSTTVQCPICKGTGEEICSFCNGSGYYDILDRRCPRCSGKGTVMCTHCFGTGHL